MIDHLKTAAPLSLLCLSFLADTQRFVFYPENQVLWCKLSPRAIYKNSWVCALAIAKRKTRMGLFVILEVLFSPGAQVFQSRPSQRKKRKALWFFKHLRIPFNFRKCFPSSGQQKHHPARGPFLHILTTPSLFLLPQRVNFRSIRGLLSPDYVSGESKNSFLLISPTFLWLLLPTRSQFQRLLVVWSECKPGAKYLHSISLAPWQSRKKRWKGPNQRYSTQNCLGAFLKVRDMLRLVKWMNEWMAGLVVVV